MRLNDRALVRRAVALCLAGAWACGGGDDDGPGPGGGGVVEVTTYFGEVPEPVPFAAVQDGDGAWELIESEDGVYSFEVESGRYGFAHACEPDSLVISFFYSTVEEGGQVNRGCFRQAGDEEEALVLITVNGLAEGEEGYVSVGSDDEMFAYEVPTTQVGGVPADTYDVIVTAGPSILDLVERILIVRDVELRAGETLEMEVDLADAVETTRHTITLEEYYPEVMAIVSLETSSGTRVRLGTYGDPQVYAGFPDAQPTDMYRILVESPIPYQMMTHHFARTPGDLTLAPPPPFEIEGTSAATTTPHVRAQVSFDRRDRASYTFSFRNFRPDRIIEGYISAGWLDDQSVSFTWQQPDLSGLAGWAESFALYDDQEVTATVTEFVGDVDPLFVLPQVPPSRLVEYTDDLDGKGVSLVEATATFVP